MKNQQMTKFNYQTLWSRIENEARRYATSPQAVRDFVTLISRREFVKLLGASAAALAFSGAAGTSQHATAKAAPAKQLARPASSTPAFPNGVAAGDVDQTSAVLWTRAANPGTVTFELASADGQVVGTYTANSTDSMIPVKVNIDGLRPGMSYNYTVTDSTGERMSGQFRTPAEIGIYAGLRFGVSGDWRGELRPYPALSNVPERNLAFFVEHGDTIYADVPSVDLPAEQAVSVDEYRIKHAEVYSERFGRNYWADVRASTAIYATIDDHEVTDDFAGGAPPSSDERFAGETVEFINQTALYRNGLQVFQEYNPLRDEFYADTGDRRVDGRPKLYRYVTFGSDAAMIILDARSFRDQNQAGTLDIFNREAIQAYLESLFVEGRTMLGRPQVEDLKRDLLAAHNAGITWKFILIPQPAQLMGWFAGNDHWEGFAPERTEVMQFIEDNNIRNVVFVAADVHTTFINNITYQTEPGGDVIPTHAFEISTGSVAFYPPTGQSLVEGAREFGLISESVFNTYRSSSLVEKDALLEDLFNRLVLRLQGYDTLGLENSLVNATFSEGGYVLGHSFGWTEFDIDAESQMLTVTTYGIPAYDRDTLEANPDAIIDQTPAVLSRFTVTPQR